MRVSFHIHLAIYYNNLGKSSFLEVSHAPFKVWLQTTATMSTYDINSCTSYMHPPVPVHLTPKSRPDIFKTTSMWGTTKINPVVHSRFFWLVRVQMIANEHWNKKWNINILYYIDIVHSYDIRTFNQLSHQHWYLMTRLSLLSFQLHLRLQGNHGGKGWQLHVMVNGQFQAPILESFQKRTTMMMTAVMMIMIYYDYDDDYDYYCYSYYDDDEHHTYANTWSNFMLLPIIRNWFPWGRPFLLR